MIQLFISRLKPFSDLLNVCKETEDPLESRKKERKRKKRIKKVKRSDKICLRGESF